MSKQLSEQGPLEKSLQNSVAFERQKNMDNRVGIIRGSVQVNTQVFEGMSQQILQKLLCILQDHLKTLVCLCTANGPSSEVHRGHAG